MAEESKQQSVNENIFTDKCESIKECNSMKRITKCLHFYQTLIETDYDALLHYLSDDNYPYLVNDYNHILLKHIGDNKTIQESREEYQLIYQQIIRFKTLKECSIENCKRFIRNNRDRQNTKLLSNNNIESSLLAFYIETLDTIHCHLIHSFDCGYKLKQNVIQQIDENKNDTDDDDKGHAAIDKNQNEMNISGLHDDNTLKHIKNILQEKRKRLENIRGLNRYKNTKFVTKIDEDDNMEKQESTGSVTSHCEDNKENKENKENENKPICYSFGYTFYYWDCYKSNVGGKQYPQNNNYSYSRLYIDPKYKNLSDEILNNNIKQITKTDWDIVVMNANNHLVSEYAKSLKSYGELCQKYNIKIKSPITAQHLISIILYCNFDTLSYEFSRTFRKIKKNEILNELKKRNQEISIWSRLLRETVECYGDTMLYNKTKVYYHGINGKLVFPSFITRFSSPTSLTVQFAVATIFAKSNGIILELEKGNGFTRYFNCSWLSCFSNEDERLIFGGKHSIKLGSIRSIMDNHNYKLYIHALTFFNYFIHKQEPAGTDGTKTLRATKTDYRIINALIKHFDDRTKYKNKFPNYINSMFDSFRVNVKNVNIDFKMMSKYYHQLAPLLFSRNKNECWCQGNYRPFLNIICNIFRNCNQISITYSKFDMPNIAEFMKEFVDDLRETTKYAKRVNAKHDVNILIECIKCDKNTWNKLISSQSFYNIWKGVKGHNEHDVNIWYAPSTQPPRINRKKERKINK